MQAIKRHFPKWIKFSLNSVIWVNSGNLKNHWSMNCAQFKHNKHSYTLYSANWQLVQMKFYSSNSIAISVNRFDWHLEPNRSVRKWKHSLKLFLSLTSVLLAAGALLMSNNFSLKIQWKHLGKTALSCCQVHYLLSTYKLLLMPRAFSRQCKFMLLKCSGSQRNVLLIKTALSRLDQNEFKQRAVIHTTSNRARDYVQLLTSHTGGRALHV